jgi:hypothetical protein
VENLNRKTVARKLKFLGKYAHLYLTIENASKDLAQEIEFDDLETFEHTKCKPLSVTLAVEYPTRRILGFQLSQMPAKGRIAKRAVKKYGFRADERAAGRKRLFEEIKPLMLEGAVIKSDANPHYPEDVKRHFPNSIHFTFLGKRGAITGQGELKKTKFDPLFRLNHTCAMFRAHVASLIRKTWNTAKNRDRLFDNLAIYAMIHNRRLPR